MQIPNATSPLRWRPIGHADQLSVVDHLDELRTRLIVSLLAVAVAFGICFWQNNELLHLINAPLAHQTQQQVRDGHGPLGATYTVQQSTRDVAKQLDTVAGVLSAQNHAAGGHGDAGAGSAEPRSATSRGYRPRRPATSP